MIDRIVSEIKTCLENDCYIAALALALTLPDVCGKAEYPNEGNTKRYIKWYNEYVGKYEKPSDPYGSDMPYSSGEVIYNLRNSLLHQGTPNIETEKIKEERCKVDKFILTIASVYDTGTSFVSYSKGFVIKERKLEVNIVYLCHSIVKAAKEYYAKNSSKFDFFNYELKDIRHSYDDLFTFENRNTNGGN